ncbi:MAG: hypothetical protein GWO23_15200, partial [Gammaproteobacteria bacterium]|nr:hypothetical protein [Gammaproteobacteria bacterium]
MTNTKEWNIVVELLRQQTFAVLGTSRQGHAYSSLVAFSATESGKSLYFATTRATRKYHNLAADNRVSLLIDNRAERNLPLYEAAAVTAYGAAEEVNNDDRSVALQDYLAKHPQLKAFRNGSYDRLFPNQCRGISSGATVSECHRVSDESMNYLVELSSSCGTSSQTVGGKAQMLAVLQQQGYMIPAAYCLPVNVYDEFLSKTGLDAFISMELQRKDFAAMRWEEIWDVSLRIRNHFVTRDWPQKMKQGLLEDIQRISTNWTAAAVRSTAPGEDSGSQSF